MFLSLITVVSVHIELTQSLDRRKVNELLNLRSNKLGKVPQNDEFIPGNIVDSFDLYTLNGELKYPGSVINSTTPIIFTLYNEKSGFLQCLFNSTISVEKLLLHSPKNTHYIFLSTNNAESNALWMKSRFGQVAMEISKAEKNSERYCFILLFCLLLFVKYRKFSLA